MSPRAHVAVPPTKPVLVYDGDCALCRSLVRRLQPVLGGRVDCQPAQDGDAEKRFPEIPDASLATSVQLVETDGQVYAGAEALFRTMALGRGWRRPLRAYRCSPAFARAAEWVYRFVADRRTVWPRLGH
jgi:predicted DCC family thiol-disulfide oxidoreductase YuxK